MATLGTGMGDTAEEMTPEATVVIPTYNRCDLLPDLLNAVLGQHGVIYNVVVVDDGSTDGTPDYLDQRAREEPRLHVLRAPNGGPATARNLGWRHATTPWIAFTDDDCLPSPDWLRCLLASAKGREIVQGRTRMPDNVPGLWDRALSISKFSGRYETCNLLVRRDLLERLGGFDERFPAAFGEDTDLGLRAVRDGASVGFAADAVVIHRIWPRSYWRYLIDRRRFAQIVMLVRYNPDARQILAMPYVLKRAHIAAWVLVPGMIAAAWVGAWWVPPAVLIGWGARYAIRTGRSPWPWPARFVRGVGVLVGNAYEAACFAVASVRHRTLVL